MRHLEGNTLYYSDGFADLEICEISNQKEIENMAKKYFRAMKGVKRHRGEANAINQILKIKGMDKQTKIQRYGFKEINIVFVSGDKMALKVAKKLGIEVINWRDFKPYLKEFLR